MEAHQQEQDPGPVPTKSRPKEGADGGVDQEWAEGEEDVKGEEATT